MEKQIVEGNKLIADSCGAKLNNEVCFESVAIPLEKGGQPEIGRNEYGLYEVNGIRVNPFQLEYHSSYDWQIPAWQKFYKTVYDFYNDDAPNEFVQLACDYESEISIGTPLTAFEIFVQALEWYNQQPK